MKKVLIVGLPFFSSKYQYVVDAYKNLDVDVHLLLNCEKLPNVESYDVKFYYAGNNKFYRMFKYLETLYKFKPDNIDCYDYSILSIFYVLIGRILGINVRFWLIGWELVGDRQNINQQSFILDMFIDVKKYFSIMCLNFAHIIYAKEHHHIESIEKINNNLLKKVEKIYNGVPVGEYKSNLLNRVRKDFLYANSVIPKRNVIHLIEAFGEMRDKNIKFSAAIYGFNSLSNEVYEARSVFYSEQAIGVFNSLNLKNYVEIHGFVKNIATIMLEYRFFVLPADIILANYALLEAMSFGLVPIVYPGNGYEEIVQDGVNGIVVKDFDLVEALERALLLSNDEYERMSRASYEKVKFEFSLDIWQKKLSKHLI